MTDNAIRTSNVSTCR